MINNDIKYVSLEPSLMIYTHTYHFLLLNLFLIIHTYNMDFYIKFTDVCVLPDGHFSTCTPEKKTQKKPNPKPRSIDFSNV